MCFADDAKGFRLLDPATDRIITSRDVKFLDEHICTQREITEVYDESLQEDQSDNETILPSTIEEEAQASDQDDDNEAEDDPDMENQNQPAENQSMRRGPGRPKIIRTGSRGRPKKDYHMQVVENQEAGMFAEVKVRDAISEPAMDDWY